MLGKIGQVPIGAGFSNNKTNTKNLYPKDRLTNFLNLDTSNKKDIHDFCAKYLVIPRNLTQGWQNALKEEQDKIKPLADKVINKTITKKELELINKEIASSSNKLTFISQKEIINLNEQIEGFEPGDGTYGKGGLFKNNKTQHVIKVNQNHNSIVSLWQDLANIILSKSKLKHCLECGLFFISSTKAPNKQYCSIYCQERRKSRRTYHRNKKLK